MISGVTSLRGPLATTVRPRLSRHWLSQIGQFSTRNKSTQICMNTHQREESQNSVPLQLTLAIIKPHICKDPFSLSEIRQIIFDDGFYFIRSDQRELTTAEAELFYEEHKGKFFYDRLVTFMSSGEIAVHALARVDAIARWRTLMGPTKVFRTKIEHPDTIRGRFGISDTRNATHGSDSPQSAAREIGFFFPDFSLPKWFDQEEPIYRCWSRTGENEPNRDEQNLTTKVEFDQQLFLHRLVPSR